VLSQVSVPTKVSSEKSVMYLDLILVKSSPWPLEIDGSKLSFYRNIASMRTDPLNLSLI